MSSPVLKIALASAVALTAGVGIGHYVASAKVERAPASSTAVSPSISHEPSAAVAPVSNPAPTGAEGVDVTQISPSAQVEDLQKKLATAEKELKTYREAEKIVPIYDDVETRQKLATELLDVSGSKEQIEEAFAKSAEIMLKDNKDPEKKKAVAAIFNKYFSWETMAPEFVRIYSEVYSVEDMQRIGKFYASDAGRIMLEKQPELMGKTMETMQKLNEKNLPKMMEEMQKVLPAKASK
ncbi:MAG: DUF2059 domain-containing protein [Bdellovibrionota bacterium]